MEASPKLLLNSESKVNPLLFILTHESLAALDDGGEYGDDGL